MCVLEEPLQIDIIMWTAPLFYITFNRHVLMQHLFSEWTPALSYREWSCYTANIRNDKTDTTNIKCDSRDVCCFIHRRATHEDDYEGAKDASNPDHPGHPQEEDHPKNVLDTRQVHSHQSAQLWSLSNTNMKSDQSKFVF